MFQNQGSATELQSWEQQKQNEEHKMERYLNQKKNELENISKRSLLQQYGKKIIG
jgi:cobalt-zinc-cadmium resistance protein CzcA